jgi:hypothetical protein
MQIPNYNDSNYTITMADSAITLSDTVTVTVDNLDNDLDVLGFSNNYSYTTRTEQPNTITLGDVVITEKKLEKLSALLDIIEGMEDSDLLDMLNTQTALNKVKNDTTESD